MSIKDKINNDPAFVKTYLDFGFISNPACWFRKPLPINSKKSKPIFFILGSGRSGNTMLRAMLISSGQIAIPPEFYSLTKIIKLLARKRNCNRTTLVRLFIKELQQTSGFDDFGLSLTELESYLLQENAKINSVEDILMNFYAFYSKRHHNKILLAGDKTPLNTLRLYWLYYTFPNAKFIHLVRDGRDVALSYTKAGLYNDLLQSARRWVKSEETVASFSEFLKTENKDDRLLHVKYENLVTKPQEELQKISSFLGITYAEEMLQFNKTVGKMGDAGKYEHHANVSKPLSTQSIENWKKKLSADEIQTLNECMSKYLLLNNYPI